MTGWLRMVARRVLSVVVASAVGFVGLTSVIPASAASNTMLYHGGHVQHHPKVFLLFWGPKWASDPMHEDSEGGLQSMFSELSGTSYNRPA